MKTAYDKYIDLFTGKDKSFNYNGLPYKVNVNPSFITITSSFGVIAKAPTHSIKSYTDFLGLAACLAAENINLLFDKEGNIINRSITQAGL